MSRVVPFRFLFDTALPVRRHPGLPRRGRRPVNLSDEYTLPDLGPLDGGPGFARLRAAWNPRGLGLGLAVTGRSSPPDCDPADLDGSDGVHFWFDTRPATGVHRATRFCHCFCLLPLGGGTDRRGTVVAARPIAQARDESPAADTGQVRTWSRVTRDGYELDAWFPSDSLHGFEPDDHAEGPAARIGFNWAVHDSELGDQLLSVGDEFPVRHDPALWAVLELVKNGQ